MINVTASIINYDKEGTLRWLCDYVSDCDKCCMFKVGEKTIALLVLPQEFHIEQRISGYCIP